MAEKQAPECALLIVGSGISGILLANVLVEAEKKLKKKIKVLVLEAGEKLPSDTNGYTNTFLLSPAKAPESPYPPAICTKKPGDKEAKLTDPSTINAGRPNTLTLSGQQFGNWQDPRQAYLIQKGPLPFTSTYERINGGTVRHWLGTSLRFVPADFEMKIRYGKFVDWPLRYDNDDKGIGLKAWYAEAEKEIGVSAEVKDQEHLGITFAQKYPMTASLLL